MQRTVMILMCFKKFRGGEGVSFRFVFKSILKVCFYPICWSLFKPLSRVNEIMKSSLFFHGALANFLSFKKIIINKVCSIILWLFSPSPPISCRAISLQFLMQIIYDYTKASPWNSVIFLLFRWKPFCHWTG